eukprot:CAMPEP_0182440460 /NCGR_PEP_ID=MMETSP1167-20130531/87082_1 /TAXON_ID=2988 /ORGANISM="Mallomonas Sp, Strain CCMP3275" /LENGTH=465 /DNA_ID=CAMNT_0024634429 /DNA_START=920 /DNA_END=2317 /DNA_ORIENTATION=+
MMYIELFNLEAMKLSLRGVTIVAASGDDGAAGGSGCGAYNPMFPASSPYVVSVGATMGAELNHEKACSTRKGAATITSGGGFSSVMPAPAFQQKVIQEYFRTAQSPVSGFNRSGRGYPDVSLAGRHFITVVAERIRIEDGTSAATPVLGGMVSLVNAERLSRGLPSLGWITPLLYSLNGSFTNDIVTGDNKCVSKALSGSCCEEGFLATEGWDPVTGFGSVDFEKFLKTMMSVSSFPPSVSPSASPSTQPSGSPSADVAPSPVESSSVSPSAPPTMMTTTALPTGSPSLFPSHSPSCPPTASPSLDPSLPPTTLPTTPPTSRPSAYPSPVPSSPSPTNSSFTVQSLQQISHSSEMDNTVIISLSLAAVVLILFTCVVYRISRNRCETPSDTEDPEADFPLDTFQWQSPIATNPVDFEYDDEFDSHSNGLDTINSQLLESVISSFYSSNEAEENEEEDINFKYGNI